MRFPIVSVLVEEDTYSIYIPFKVCERNVESLFDMPTVVIWPVISLFNIV